MLPPTLPIRVILWTLIVHFASSEGNEVQASSDANIFSDLWDSLTQSGKAPSCPGECIHAITSIFCDHVLEEISCGANYLRCCVPSDFSYGTPVETSPPLGHEIDKLYAVTSSNNVTSTSIAPAASSLSTPPPTASPLTVGLHRLTTTQVPNHVQTVDIRRPSFPSTFPYPHLSHPVTTSTSTPYSAPASVPSTSPPVSSSTSAPFSPSIAAIWGDIVSAASTLSSTSSSTFESMHPKCPGVCVRAEYARYCGNIMSNGQCDSLEEECCLQSDQDSGNLTSPVGPNKKETAPIVETVAYPDTRSKNLTVPFKESHYQDVSYANCSGTCVAPLFSLLCDEVDHSKSCPNGGSCCINKEPTTTPPTVGPCPGTCIPTILSGVCNRPSQLILKTSDCFAGTICCSAGQRDQDSNENKDDISESIPVHVVSQPPPRPNPPLLFPQKHIPLHQAHPQPIPHPYFHRPNRPFGLPPFLHASQPQRPMFQGPLVPNQPPITLQTLLQQQPQVQPQARPSLPSSPLPPLVSQLQHPPQPLPQPMEFANVDSENPKDESLPSAGPLPPVSSSSAPPTNIEPFVGGPQFCPGPCISPLLKFTCFGSNAIYPKFHCAKYGQVCCASMSDIQVFEAAVLANNGILEAQQGQPTQESQQEQHHPSPQHYNNNNKDVIITSTTVAPIGSQPVRPPPKSSNPYTCGVKGTQRRESPRIVGGTDALPGEWCWQIALINAQNQYLCGGALIGAQWVVTAAHCITNLVRSGEEIYVRVGDYDLANQPNSKTAQTQKVTTTYIHHNHNTQTLDNDIALLKMQSPVELNESVCLICLPARGSNRKPGKKCTVTGYGYTSESGPIALKVREAQVPIDDDQDCTVKINAVTEKLFILPASSFCAGGDEGNDACQGDGGGPLVCEVDGYYELTGLVSWGFGCGRQDVPAVYVKVSSFIGWINQIISVNNQ